MNDESAHQFAGPENEPICQGESGTASLPVARLRNGEELCFKAGALFVSLLAPGNQKLENDGSPCTVSLTDIRRPGSASSCYRGFASFLQSVAPAPKIKRRPHVRCVISTLSPPDQPFYRDDHLFVDLRQQVVTLDSETLTLTPMEYRLLALLLKHAGETVPRPTLLTLTPIVDAHVWRLRKKLGKYAYQYIEAIKGVGYRFRPGH